MLNNFSLFDLIKLKWYKNIEVNLKKIILTKLVLLIKVNKGCLIDTEFLKMIY